MSCPHPNPASSPGQPGASWKWTSPRCPPWAWISLVPVTALSSVVLWSNSWLQVDFCHFSIACGASHISTNTAGPHCSLPEVPRQLYALPRSRYECSKLKDKSCQESPWRDYLMFVIFTLTRALDHFRQTDWIDRERLHRFFNWKQQFRSGKDSI